MGVLEAASQLRRGCLVPLGALDIHERESLQTLQSRTMELLTLQNSYLHDQFLRYKGINFVSLTLS